MLSAKAVFINLDGSKVPFLIESASDEKGIILKLDEVDSPEAATALLNKELYLEVSEVSQDTKLSQAAVHPLTSYFIYDQNDKQIAIIEELIEYPDQLLAQISYAGGTHLIPIHEELIIELNEEQKILKLEIVEGLLDL